MGTDRRRHRAGNPAGFGPGRALILIGMAHAGWGALAYRREMVDIARSGVVGSVGDGLFQQAHARDARAAGFWFMFASPLVALMGYEVDAAHRAGDGHAVTVAGACVLSVGIGGAAVIPRSGFWLAMPVGLWLLRDGRRLSRGTSSPVE